MPTAMTRRQSRNALTALSNDALGSLRQDFIADPEGTDLSPLRPVIARSWKRSALCSVPTKRSVMEAIAEPQLDEQLMRLAAPVLDDLEQLCIDVNGCVSLSDPYGTMSVFRGEPAMVRWADKTFPTLGGCMAEDVVGTNSDGTAIEEGRAVQVWGGEHFNEALQHTYCTSVPIIDPLRRSLRGVLSLTLPEQLALELDPRAILFVVYGAASDITRALAARLAPGEQALLSEYLREVRKRGTDAVVAMDEHTTIVSRSARDLLEQEDYAVLAAYARETGESDQVFEREIKSSPSEAIQLRARPISANGSSVGAVMRLRKVRPNSPILSASTALPSELEQAVVGVSQNVRRAVDLAKTVIEQHMPAYIVGERGTGKTHLARAIAGEFGRTITEIDCEAPDADLERAEAALDDHEVLVLRHAHLLSADRIEQIADRIRNGTCAPLLLTMRQVTDPVLPLLSALQAIEIRLDPLRIRREDIPGLVDHFLARIGSRRRPSARLLDIFAAAEWPGNAEQLREVVASANLQSQGPDLRLEDLTDVHRKALARSRLSRLQVAELQQIQEAMLEARGNRVKAAAILRIGRSTLYRKIDFYSDRGFEFGLDS